AAATVNQGATPSVSATAIGREVSVTWGAATLSNGAPVGGYVVERYPFGGGSAALSSVGSCAGSVSATSCAEDDVPAGTWKYTVTPVLGGWHGAESLTSGVVTVAAATLTVNGSPFGNAAFTPLTADATGSGINRIKYSTDGSDPTISGTAEVYAGAFTISAQGTTTVKFYATDVAANASAVQSQAVKIDTTAPTGGALTVNGTAASGAGTAGYNSSGSFTISAISDYTDAGSGLASSTLTRQAATLSGGSCGSYGAAATIASRLTPIAQT